MSGLYPKCLSAPKGKCLDIKNKSNGMFVMLIVWMISYHAACGLKKSLRDPPKIISTAFPRRGSITDSGPLIAVAYRTLTECQARSNPCTVTHDPL